MTEPCKYENLMGQMASDIATTKDVTNKIFDRLEGKKGLVSRMAVQETKQAGTPSIKAIMIQASIWGGFTGGAVVIVKAFFN